MVHSFENESRTVRPMIVGRIWLLASSACLMSSNNEDDSSLFVRFYSGCDVYRDIQWQSFMSRQFSGRLFLCGQLSCISVPFSGAKW